MTRVLARELDPITRGFCTTSNEVASTGGNSKTMPRRSFSIFRTGFRMIDDSIVSLVTYMIDFRERRYDDVLIGGGEEPLHHRKAAFVLDSYSENGKRTRRRCTR